MDAGGGRAQGVNLDRTNILVFDPDPVSMSITTQILAAFGARQIQRCEAEAEAARLLQATAYDLVIVDATLTGEAGYAFIRWLRRNACEAVRLGMVLVITGHTQLARINAARDCGASFVLAKPLTPARLMRRIQWMSKDRRVHVECATYVGPERRFRFLGPPAGVEGRRADDYRGEVGAAETPNMSQQDIDAMMRPMRVTI